ncbi:MAG: transglycosylase SLT domain-containing protein [Myxococcota bacterium]
MTERQRKGRRRADRRGPSIAKASLVGFLVLAPVHAAAQSPSSADEARAAFERLEAARAAAFDGDAAARFRAADAAVDSAAADLRQIEAAVVAAVQAERAAVWGEPTVDERFVWIEYGEGGRERRQVDFAREALVFETLDGEIGLDGLRRRVRAALVEGVDEAVARDPIAREIESRAADSMADEAPLESAPLASTPILWPLLTGDAALDPAALDAVVGLLVARAQRREVEIGRETMQQVEIPLDPATVLAQLERLQRGDFAAPMPGFTPQAIPRPVLPEVEPEPPPSRAEAPPAGRPPPLPRRFPARARSYLELVDRHARARSLDPALVFAIIETESAFNPLARSPAPAYGLMQIVPRSAGKDASAVLYGRPRLLAPSYLYDAERNVQIGAIYLDIVLNRYLAGIRDPRSRLYCAIAAYNTGAGNVFRAFTGRTRPKAAFREINALSPEDVYRKLVWQLPYRETRRYLTNVVQRMDKYRR